MYAVTTEFELVALYTTCITVVRFHENSSKKLKKYHITSHVQATRGFVCCVCIGLLVCWWVLGRLPLALCFVIYVQLSCPSCQPDVHAVGVLVCFRTPSVRCVLVSVCVREREGKTKCAR
jgi:hypothetical protein